MFAKSWFFTRSSDRLVTLEPLPVGHPNSNAVPEEPKNELPESGPLGASDWPGSASSCVGSRELAATCMGSVALSGGGNGSFGKGSDELDAHLSSEFEPRIRNSSRSRTLSFSSSSIRAFVGLDADVSVLIKSY